MEKLLLFLLVPVCVLGIFALDVQNHEHASEKLSPVTEKLSVPKMESSKEPDRLQAPSFTLKTLSGRQVFLGDYLGRYVLLNMWASWCGPCQEEAASLVKIDHKFSDKKLMVLGVNMTSQESSVDDVRDFVKKHRIDFPILLDKDGKVMESYHVLGIPTTYLLDPEGRIIHRFRGAITVNNVTELLKGNLSK
ncbi:MAG TPA: TlpA disulfide reductase family protein [Bacillales bacterium]